MATVKKGDEVEWNYGKGKGKGEVAEVKKGDVEKDAEVYDETKGSAEEPAVVIKQGGKTIVKSASEVKKTK